MGNAGLRSGKNLLHLGVQELWTDVGDILRKRVILTSDWLDGSIAFRALTTILLHLLSRTPTYSNLDHRHVRINTNHHLNPNPLSSSSPNLKTPRPPPLQCPGIPLLLRPLTSLRSPLHNPNLCNFPRLLPFPLSRRPNRPLWPSL